MPPGNARTQPPTRVIEKTTVQTCLSIARRIEQDRHLAGDTRGSEAAHQIAETIQRELLEQGWHKGGYPAAARITPHA
ncbi:MAG TPA: hypothetical protein VF804_06680 [Holophagaceae bacterium]